MSRILSVLIFLFFTIGFLTGCSVLRASPAETSPFLTHGSELKPWYERAPWDAVWSSSPGKIMVKSDTPRTIFIAPVNTQYLNYRMDKKSGKEVKFEELSQDEIDAMSNNLRQSFIDAIKAKPETNMTVVESQKGANLVLEIAMIELTPTIIAENVVADVVGVVVPGSKAIEQAAVTGGEAISGAVASGSIAIEMRILDGQSNEVLAEAKDRETDRASILPNVRDFEKYGWSRKTSQEWAHQFAEIFSTDAKQKVASSSTVSFVPW